MKKIGKIKYILVLVAILGTLAGTGQTQPSLDIIADRNSILLGEQIELKLQAKVPAGMPVSELFKMPDSLSHLEVLRRGNIDSSVDGNIKLYTQSFTITGFDSGTWVFPAATLKADKKSFASKPLSISISPVQLKDSTYHDIRQIIEVPPPPRDWTIWILALVSAVVLGLLIWLWTKRKKKPTVAQESTQAAGALEEALKQLQQLEKDQLAEAGDLPLYYSRLSNILRTYTGRKFGVKAMQITTDELLVNLHNRLSAEQPGKLAGILRIADAVKFAKYQPDLPQCHTDIKSTELVIKEMDRLN